MEQFWIDHCRVEPARNVLVCEEAAKRRIAQVKLNGRATPIGNHEVPLEPKVMAVLCALARHHGDVVQRSELLEQIWSDQYAADESLTRAISILRKTFRNFVRSTIIETIPKQGYRLVHPVRLADCKRMRNAATSEADVSTPLNAVSDDDAPQNSIAVLAFIDLSPKGDQEHLADGIAEEILNSLTGVSGLQVSGRTSSFSFKGKPFDITTIARTLNVAHVLEGSLRIQGGRARVTAQLIGRNGFHLWSQNYDRELNDVFQLQEDIARDITGQIIGLIPERAQQDLTPKLTRIEEAYEAFVQGRDLTHKLNGQTTIPAGIDRLRRAVTLDPEFSEAWSWLGLAHFILPEFSRTPEWSGHIEQSQVAIDRALAINPECSIALLVRAMQTTYNHRLDEALAIYEKALNVDPHNIETMAGYGLGTLAIGQLDAARAKFDSILRQDPLCGLWHTVYGGILLNQGAFAEAEDYFKKSFELGFGAAAFGVAHRMAQRGETSEAVAFLQDNYEGLAPVEQSELRFPAVRRLVYQAYLFRTPVARPIVAAAMKVRSKKRKAQPTSASIISFLFLEEPQAFMDNILEKPNPYLGYTIARIWEPTEQSRLVREHPNFPAFTKALGLDRAWAKYGKPRLA